MKLTRPKRRLAYSIAFAVLWCVVAMFLLMPRSYTWRSSVMGGQWGDAERTFGVLKYLTVEYRDFDIKGVPAGPDPGTTWRWGPPATMLTGLALLFMAGICRTAYLVAVKKDRLVGQCDECGYDLTGLLSSRCPECGTPVQPDEAAVAEPHPAG